MGNSYYTPFLEKFDERLTELERKIEEDEYDPSVDGFENEYYQLKEDCQNLADECFDENDEILIDGFKKRLRKIHEEQDLYDEDDTLNMMFPNKEPDSGDDFDEGFSTDKYFGLD